MNRRCFLRISAAVGGGLLVGVYGCTRRDELADGITYSTARPADDGDLGVPLDLYIEILADGTVVLTAPVPELGQGVRTALPMLLAEELEVDWTQVRVRQAAAGDGYGRMTVGGSYSVRVYWEPLRLAGATARTALVAAAADRWGVTVSECVARKGIVRHVPSGRELAYGAVAADAARRPSPEGVQLKSSAEHVLIGRPLAGPDLLQIVRGRAAYGIDTRMPGMAFAVVARPPVHGGTLRRVDRSAAMRIPGVLRVLAIEPHLHRNLRYGAVRGGVAVVATDSWTAMEGRRALVLEWDDGPNAEADGAAIDAELARVAGGPAERVVRSSGREPAPRSGSRELSAIYQLPILAHATMEPMNFTAHARQDACDLIGPTQDPLLLRALAAAALGLERDSVRVQPTLAGGGFGRRLAVDYGIEAALVSRAAGVPVQVVWSREDDLRHDYYRAPSAHTMRAVIAPDGVPERWNHHVVSAGLLRHIQGPDVQTLERYDVPGAADMPYAIPRIEVGFTAVDLPIQVGSWRSVSHSFNVFAVESFIDEIARSGGQDPLALRRLMLGPGREEALVLPYLDPEQPVRFDTRRLLRVLETVASKSRWGKALPPGRGRGIACCHFKQAYAAHVAEVTVGPRGVRVDRIVAALDVGSIVNPSGLAAQVEGAALEGVATVLKWGITIERGRIREGNFHEYPLLSHAEAPEVEVHLIPGSDEPRGAGEPPYPSVAPAITNAIFDATGVRVRRLPLAPGALGKAVES